MGESSTVAKPIIWNLTDDLIDPEHLAEACVRVQMRIKSEKSWARSPKVWIIGAVALVIDVFIGFRWSPWVLWLLTAYVVAALVVMRLWNRRVVARTARHLRDHPFIYPPTVVTASPDGLHQVDAEGESRHSWRVYESVWTQDDLLVLVQSPFLMLPLPHAALFSDHAPDDAAKLLGWWIDAAASAASTPAGNVAPTES